MSAWQDLDEYLSHDYGVDAWSDFCIDRAYELLGKLSDDEWAILNQTWPLRSQIWQAQLADALLPLPAARIVPILRQMLASSDMRVALAAADSLEGRDDVFTPDESDRAPLERLLARVPDGERVTIRALLDRIPPPK